MKIFKLLLIIFTISIISISCSKTPTACFSVDKTTAQVDSVINLDATCSIDAEKYIWMSTGPIIFSAGGTDAPKNSVTSNTEGVYTITLRVENGNKTDEITQTITITP